MAHYHRHHPPPGQKRQPVYYGRNGGFLSARNSLLILLLLCINNNRVHGFFTSTSTSTTITSITTSRGQMTKRTAKSAAAAAATTLLLQARRRPLLSTPPTPSSTQTQLYMAYVPQKEEDNDNSKNNALPTTTTTTSSSSSSSSKKTVEKKPLLTPKVGDIVRYYDLDGGNRKGQELVGKITFLTKVAATAAAAAAAAGAAAAATSGTSNNKNNNNKNNNSNTYVAELTQLEDLGEGYFAEYSSTKRMSKKSDRDILQVSPLRASFVRSEQAYKVPFDAATQKVKVRQEQYDIPLDGSWEGPQPAATVNMDVVEADGILYSQLKFKLLKNAALAGLLGTVIANIVQGTEDAAIYFAGAVASVLYLFFLSIKIDTLGSSPNQKLGTNVSNLRFLMPVLVVVGVALYNQSRGEANPLAASTNPFGRITTEQFAAAILGFLTYRVPLFLGQVQEAFQQEQGGDGSTSTAGVVLPGSAGVAIQLAQAATAGSAVASNAVDESSSSSLIPVLLISGPQYTGRDALVEQLLREDDRLVPPILVDKMTDGVTFERLANRNEFLQLDSETEPRYGWTKDGILKAAAMAASSSRTNSDGNNDNAAPAETTTTTTTTTTAQQQTSNNNKVVVVNADVALAKKLQYSLSGARLIGVWVGLDSVQEFERRIGEQIDQGLIETVDPAASAGGEEDETRESVIRACIKEIVQEIDFGLSSGIFEFTILNQDPAKSLKELKEAASYCFK